MQKRIQFLSVIGFIGISTAAHAFDPPKPGFPPPFDPTQCGRGGTVTEHAYPGFKSTFGLQVTDCQGKVIKGADQTKSGTGAVVFQVAGTINGVKTADYRNHTIMNEHVKFSKAPSQGGFGPNAAAAVDDGVGAESYLNIESLYKDPVTGLWSFEGVPAMMDAVFGPGVVIGIPDLYADTNGDGVIGAGDVLYSWVDMRVYLQHLHAYELGDHYTIVDGQVAGLPGMWFSSSEIFLDPVLGPQPTGGAWFSSSTGDAEALSEHDLDTVPEPAIWLMMLLGLGATGVLARRAGPRLQPGSV